MQHLDEGMIHAWLDGELPAAERDAAKAHVAQCSECSAAVAEARGFIAASSRILTALDAVPGGVLPTPVSSPPAGTRAPARFTLPRAWMAAAAVLILSTATAIAIRPRSDEGGATRAQRDEMHARRENTTPSTPAAAPAASPLAANAPKPAALAEERQKSADKRDGALSLARKDARVRADGDSAPMVVAGAARATEFDSAATLDRNSMAAAAPQAAERATDAMAVKAEARAARTAVQVEPQSGVAGGRAAVVPRLRVPESRGSSAPIVPQIVSRSTTKENGDTVVTTVYSVNGVPVSLIDQSSARIALLRPQSKASVADQPLAEVRDSASAMHSITWSDSTGHTRTLRGAMSMSELEELKRALFGPMP